MKEVTAIEISLTPSNGFIFFTPFFLVSGDLYRLLIRKWRPLLDVEEYAKISFLRDIGVPFNGF